MTVYSQLLGLSDNELVHRILYMIDSNDCHDPVHLKQEPILLFQMHIDAFVINTMLINFNLTVWNDRFLSCIFLVTVYKTHKDLYFFFTLKIGLHTWTYGYKGIRKKMI